MKTNEEIIDALMDAIAFRCMSAQVKNDGAGYYECPSCRGRVAANGFVSGNTAYINEIEHHAQCNLYNAYKDAKDAGY